MTPTIVIPFSSAQFSNRSSGSVSTDSAVPAKAGTKRIANRSRAGFLFTRYNFEIFVNTQCVELLRKCKILFEQNFEAMTSFLVNQIVITPFSINHLIPWTKSLSEINPSDHQPAFVLIQVGISLEPEPVPCCVSGICIIPSLIMY